MNNKGMAISSILYTILVLFLVLLFGILGLISSAKTTFDTLKNKLLTDLNDTKPRVTAVEDDFVDNKIIVSVFSRKYISSYYISQSEDPVTKEVFNQNANKQDFQYPIGTFNIDYMKENNNQYYIYLKDIHDNVYKYPINIDQSSCNVPIGTAYNFEYTGSPQEFIAPCDGIYDVELWGAQGGGDNNDVGGLGAYTKGDIELVKNTNLYIQVGQAGTYDWTNCNDSTYNGGSSGGCMTSFVGGSGGGSTDIRLSSGNWNDFDSLKSRIMVAAGGAGALYYNGSYHYSGKPGGGLIGTSGVVINLGGPTSHGAAPYAKQTKYDNQYYFSGANRYNILTSAENGKFGIAGKIYYNNEFLDTGSSLYGALLSGGSGGYYGGASGVDTSSYGGTGSSGSSFISGYNGCDAIAESSTLSSIVHTGQPNHYSGKVFSDAVMIDGKGCNWSTGSATNCGTNQPQPDGTTATGHSGNGYARITLSSYDQSPLLNYNILSNDLDSKSRITVDVNETKTFNITVKSLNSETTNYELYYKTSNDNKGISVSSTNLVSGSIGSKKSKTAQITITNTGSVSTIVKFIVAGSTTDREPVIDGKKIKSLNDCEYATGQSWEFDYTGNIQEFTSLCKGTYKLEVWGAQGGGDSTYIGGYGAYSTGITNLNKDDVLYLAVGEAGKWSTVDYKVLPSTYNGGGGATDQWSSANTTEWHGSGGGATHIAKVPGTLSSIGYTSFVTNNNGYMVAAGGGGAGYFIATDSVNMQGGHGGGIQGTIGNTTMSGSVFASYINNQSHVPATQTAASTLYYGGSYPISGSFGQAGGNYIGGGSGLYGGAGTAGRSSGGSSYIGNSKLTNKKMVCYNCTTSTNTNTYTESNTCTSATPTANCSKQGNGYARITYLGKSTETLAAKILINNPVVKTNPTLTTTATTSAESGLYSMNVNNGFSGSKGKTYYFRGIVNNNYVSFAGQTWRIVRINEDGTIRLVLNSGINNNTAYTFNSTSSIDNAYFSNSDVTNGAMRVLNNWYNSNLSSYANSIATGNYYCEAAKVTFSQGTLEFGNATFTYYADYTPTFKCISDGNTKGNINTNIGLLTYDEVLFAGAHRVGYSGENKYYLEDNMGNTYYYWTLTPGQIVNGNMTITVVSYNQSFSSGLITSSYPLRPVINLNYNVEVTGSGTSSDPYVVKNN